MDKQFVFRGRTISYTLRRYRRSRRLRLAISGDGSVRVSVPFGVSEEFVERFVLQKAELILEKLDVSGLSTQKRITPEERREKYMRHKTAALGFVMERIAHFNRIYGFTFERVCIRDQRTRWGSCSRSGNLSFNYRLLLLPPHLADYVIVHELCHLREHNHSQRFWKLVALLVPTYKDLRRELRSLSTEDL